MARCVICEGNTSGSLEFCGKHYNEYKDDILEKKSWVRVLKSDAQRERRRREREYDNASLDEIVDRQYNKDRW
jgi:hypothetical protein